MATHSSVPAWRIPGMGQSDMTEVTAVAVADVGNLISGSSAFSKSSLNIWKFSVQVLLNPGLEMLNITLLSCEMSTIVQSYEHSLALPFFGIGKKN